MAAGSGWKATDCPAASFSSRFRCPHVETEAAVRREPHDSREARAPAVLIVEGDPDLAHVMSASPQAQGFRTVHAPTGSAVIAHCRDGAPLLILLDLVLPDMDGFTFVESLSKLDSSRSVPLVVHSTLEVNAAD